MYSMKRHDTVNVTKEKSGEVAFCAYPKLSVRPDSIQPPDFDLPRM